jgi:hypothetical protein
MKRILIATLVLAVAISASVVFAFDYSKYTTDELNKMRGTMQNVTQEERDTFRAEWQKRIQNMTPEERQEYMGRPENAPQRGGYGMGMGKGMGGGRGRR